MDVPSSGDEESGDFQSWTKASRHFFAKDKAYRKWRAEDDNQDAAWETFKRGPWKAIQKRRWNERAKTRVLGVHRSSWDQLHRLLKKDWSFRIWQPRAGEDKSWEVFTAKGGPWQARERDRARDRREIRQNRLPCETAAIESTKALPSARGKQMLLDRMPSRANIVPLTSQLPIFETFTRQASTRADEAPMHAAPASREPTTDEWTQYRRLCRQNVTCFTLMEESHPINFYEQRDVCSECGCERFSTSSHKQCCQSGALVLVRKMPASLLSLISESPGLSKQSRAANDLFRLAQMALPKGTHRIPDMYQHLKVTGVPFAIVPNLNERSSTRSFLDDPYERLEARNKFDSSTRPSDRAIAIIEAVLTRENSLVRELVNWAKASTTTAHLVLKWPGTTT
jgi:hypothetical protein